MWALGVAVAAWGLFGPPALAAQEGPSSGRLTPRVEALAEPGQSYALYLPSAYDAGRRWPLLILMDPRGRALAPMESVVPAAERLGFVVVSSYHTASDGSAEPNIAALNALLADAPERWSVDTNRVYLAGFSGTARFAWEAAQRLAGHVPAVLGFGAGPSADQPRATTLLATRSGAFEYFGAVGESDFNFHEVLTLEERLEELHVPHRVAVFTGGHDWPPPTVMERAVEWLELRAVALGLAGRPTAWVDSIYTAWQAEARALEDGGRTYDAWRAYRGLVRDFADLRDVEATAAKAEELAGSAGVEATLLGLERSARRQAEWDERYRGWSERLRREGPGSLEHALGELRVADLLNGATASEDPVDAASHARILELLFVRTSFYEARGYVAAGDWERALLVSRVAQAVKPEAAAVALSLAGILARLGRVEEALAELARYAESPGASRAAVEGDELLESLRVDPRYRAILERLSA